jgi:hypothetical protein
VDPHGHAGGATSITEHWNNRRGCQYLCRLGLLFQDIFWQHLVSVVVRQPVRLAITRSCFNASSCWFALASSGQGNGSNIPLCGTPQQRAGNFGAGRNQQKRCKK